jgi:hypothetical protein
MKKNKEKKNKQKNTAPNVYTNPSFSFIVDWKICLSIHFGKGSMVVNNLRSGRELKPDSEFLKKIIKVLTIK